MNIWGELDANRFKFPDLVRSKLSEDTLVMQLKSAESHKWWQSKDAAVSSCKIFHKITLEIKREYFIVVSNFLSKCSFK